MGSAQRVIQSALSILKQLQSPRRGGGGTAAEADGVSEATAGDEGEEEGGEGEVEITTTSGNGGVFRGQGGGMRASAPAGAAESSGRDFRSAWTTQMAKDGLVGALVALAYPDRIAM